MRILIALAFVTACHKPSPNCERAVRQVIALTTAGPPDSKPKADEQAVIDQVQHASIDRCNAEGLSDAQRDCILAAKSLRDRAFLTCPALVKTPPTWIIAPIGHPEALDELDRIRSSGR